VLKISIGLFHGDAMAFVEPGPEIDETAAFAAEGSPTAGQFSRDLPLEGVSAIFLQMMRWHKRREARPLRSAIRIAEHAPKPVTAREADAEMESGSGYESQT